MLLTSLLRIYLTRSLRPFEFTNKNKAILDYENEENLGLYVHIPFCRSICSFCPYCKVVYNHETVKKYKLALLKEIDMVGSILQAKKEVTSLYLGGGTPALMIDNMKEIIDCVKKYFDIKQGIGVELHPDDINKGTLNQLKSSGVTMISIGIQSFNEKCLLALGRRDGDFIKKLRMVDEAKFDVVDVDLIFGIPMQTETILTEDIEKAFSNGATQISTYPFIDFTFANNTYKPLPEKEKKRMLGSISDYCKETERERTSVWTFAKKGTGKYSSVTRDNFLGFGVSATTLLRDQFKINTFSIDDYIEKINFGQLPTSLTLSFSLRQRAVYYLFWSAYSMVINPVQFQKIIGKPLKSMYGFELWLCKLLGFLKERDGKYYLTEKGAYYYHLIEQAYTTAYIDKMWNISRTTAFPEQIVLK
ncbi:MAG TPA: radical SAM protein [Bacillales bacterium]|nr:radical SAM protein [Bacillales bacterium]